MAVVEQACGLQPPAAANIPFAAGILKNDDRTSWPLVFFGKSILSVSEGTFLRAKQML